MQKLIRAAALAFGVAAPVSADVAGEWRAPDPAGAVPVRVGPCGYDAAVLCAMVPFEIAHPMAGTVLFTDMRPGRPGRWAGGQARSLADERVFDGRLRLQDGALVVERCAALACAVEVWAKPQAGDAGPAPDTAPQALIP